MKVALALFRESRRPRKLVNIRNWVLTHLIIGPFIHAFLHSSILHSVSLQVLTEPFAFVIGGEMSNS